MKVLLVGYHNPHFVNTVVLREKALGYMGHEVVFFDDARYIIPGRIRSKFSVLHQWDLSRLNQNLIDLAIQQKPDLCLVVGGQNIWPQTVSRIKEMGVPIALWTTDVPVDFRNILDSASFYEHLFCAGTEALDIFHARGLKNVIWLPFACDPDYHKRISLSDSEKKLYARDIVFVGSYYPNRASLIESVSDFELGVWGPYWQKLTSGSPLKDKAVNIKMNYDQWVKIFNASKINLVIHYQDDKVPCHQASPKLFEAMACGCFVLTDRQKDVQSLFKDREHLVFFEDVKDLRSKIEYFLEHEDQRKTIARAGYEEVIKNHTYRHRMEKIFNILHLR